MTETGDLVELTLREAGEALAAHTVTSVELLEATLRRIEQTEPVVHAYAEVGEERARAAAEAADAEIAAGRRRGPLHGIPLSVKDVLFTADAPTEGGSRLLAGFRPTFDATAVRKLREAGAVVVGKAVTHEFAYGKNDAVTRNAWDPDCNPGGSSAGSGVSVAARSAFGSLGTDSGGSVRVPAALNGVVGLKPTYGRVSRHGVIPLSFSLDHVGPLARTVEDAALILDAIAGPDPLDRTTSNLDSGDLLGEIDDGLAGMRIGIDRAYFFSDALTDEVRSATLAAVDDLRSEGAAIVDVSIPELEISAGAGLAIMLAEASAVHHESLGARAEAFDPGTRHMLELGELVSAVQYLTAQRARAHLCDAIRRRFDAERLDALLAPTMPTTAMKVSMMPPDGVMRYSFPANLTGQPAISIPCGFSSERKPIAIQLMGRPGGERRIVRLAHAYERLHEWHRRSPFPFRKSG